MNRAQQMIGKGNLSQKAKDKLYEYGVPSYMHGAVVRYMEEGIPPGSFLSAVINNDLREACSRADDTNKLALHSYVMWFYNWAPVGTWGHPDAVRDWCQPLPEGE